VCGRSLLHRALVRFQRPVLFRRSAWRVVNGQGSHEMVLGHGDGDVVSFGSRELRGEGQGRPLTVRWEVEVAAGKRGDLLALEQTAAIWDMLAWLAARKQADKDAKKRGNGEPPGPSR